MKLQSNQRRKPAFTLVELLVTITIIAALASLILMMARRGIDSARTSKSLANLRQINIGIGSWAAENNMRYPINYKSNAFGASTKPKEEIAAVWYEAAGRNLYPYLHEKAAGAGLPWMWGTRYSNGYEDTAFRSPSAEKGYNKTIASYGYNVNFQRTDEPGSQTTVISVDPSKFNAGRTCLVADNSGKTHSLSPDGDTGSASLNARNGASGPFKRDGRVTALFLDGHVETLTAARAKELNNKKDDPFWGTGS